MTRVIKLEPVRYRLIQGPDGGWYTEIWVDGLYTRIQRAFTKDQAITAVKISRERFTFKD